MAEAVAETASAFNSEEAMTTPAVISMPYIGSCLSVNHAYKRGRNGRLYLDPEAAKWKMALKAEIAHALPNVLLSLPVLVHVDGYFKDKRTTPDRGNLEKLLVDGVAEGLGRSNDKLISYETNIWEPGHEEPELIISITVERLAYFPTRWGDVE